MSNFNDPMMTASGPNSSRRKCRVRFIVLSLFMGVAGPACVEFTHFGQVSDREGSFPVNGVSIWQQDNDGSWREIGTTDGKGKWNIMKAKVKGGGRIKLQKPGYHTMIVAESDFLQQHSILMEPTDAAQFGGDGGAWGN